MDCQCICLHKVSLSNTLLALKGRCIDSPFFFFPFTYFGMQRLAPSSSERLAPYFRELAPSSSELAPSSSELAARHHFTFLFPFPCRLPHHLDSTPSTGGLSHDDRQQLMLIDFRRPPNSHFIVVGVRRSSKISFRRRCRHPVLFDASRHAPSVSSRS